VSNFSLTLYVTINFLSFVGHDGSEKGEITDILHNTLFEETMPEDHGHTDVVCLPNDDTWTDDEEGPDDVIGIVDIQNVPRTLEIHFLSSESCENKEQADPLPSTTREVSKSRRLRNIPYLMIQETGRKLVHPTQNSQPKEIRLVRDVELDKKTSLVVTQRSI
jgi:hypothetical protein